MIKNEPVLASAIASVVGVLLVQLGIPVDDNLANAISVLVVAGCAVFARSKVAPVRNAD